MHDLANIEEFLKDQDQTVEFKESLASVEETCLVEHNGSTTWKEIFLLVRNVCSISVLIVSLQRSFAKHFDGSLSELLRMEADGEPHPSGSPHLYVVESQK